MILLLLQTWRLKTISVVMTLCWDKLSLGAGKQLWKFAPFPSHTTNVTQPFIFGYFVILRGWGVQVQEGIWYHYCICSLDNIQYFTNIWQKELGLLWQHFWWISPHFCKFQLINNKVNKIIIKLHWFLHVDTFCLFDKCWD